MRSIFLQVLCLMFIVSLCLYLNVKKYSNVEELPAPDLRSSTGALLLKGLEEKLEHSNGSKAPAGQLRIKVDKSASRQLEHTLVEKISGSKEILTCQGQTDQIKHQLNSKLVLPRYVIDHINTYVFFLGHPHSGHSIIGSLIDSHPHVVISHEMGMFKKLSQGVIAPNKEEIFNAIWKNTVETIDHGIRAANTKGYNLTVSNLCEGKYVDNIDVIGDKSGQGTVKLLLERPKKWLAAFNILKSLNLTLKVMLVLRNPYDVIASNLMLDVSIMGNLKYRYAYFKKNNMPITFTPKQINFYILFYFKYLKAIMEAKKTYNLDIIEVHGKNIILDPKGSLLQLCNDLGVTCSKKYLDICSNKIYKTQSRTRRLINWTNESVKMVQQNIEKYTVLKGYNFDSM